MSRFTPIDDAVRTRVRTDLQANLCVEAGAGTGKTTVLVDRIVEVLATGFASVDEVAVITFTDAAAAELAGRVRQRLEERLDAAADDTERANLHAALQGLHRAHVETIHAFASTLLRERPVEAGLDPGFEVLNGLPAQIAFDEAYDRWLADLLAGDHPEVATAIRRGFDLKNIRQLVETINGHRSLSPFAAEPLTASAVDAHLRELREKSDELRGLLPKAGCDEVGIADIEAVLAWTDALDTAADDPAELDRELLFRAPKLNYSRGLQTDWDEAESCQKAKRLRKEIAKEVIPALHDAMRTEAIVAMLPHAQGFVDTYERERKAAGTADFDDLLEWARDLLATSPEAREYFRRRFRVLLVDEFQDTDPVQADIAMCIASDDDPGDDWLSMRPRPGGLTVVGDPKQSIYRFRGADIAVYDAVRRGPLVGGEAQLVQNFRSTGGVLGFVNGVFDRVLVEEPGVQVANTRLKVGSAALPDESRSVSVVHGEPTGSADGDRAAEAHLLVSTIQRALRERWEIRDPATGGVRPVEPGDVVVLLPRRTALDIYLDAFRRAGLPVRAEGGRSFFQRQEVRDLASTLQAIDDPLDQVALVACLRSSAFGCSDEEIYLHVAAGNRLDYRFDATDSPASVADAFALLKDLHRCRAQLSLSHLVRQTLERTRLVEIALAGWDGQQSAANLVKLADQARGFSASGAGGLRGFARWLSQQRASSDEAEANVAEETDAVVRIMTIHASKGLEFPVVALANLGSQPWSPVEPVPERAARRLHVRIGRKDDGFRTPGFKAAWEGEQLRMSAEEKRLLYVAATRARDRLIVPVVSKDDAKGRLLDELRPSLPPHDPASYESDVDGCFVLDPTTFPSLPDDDPPPPELADDAAVDAAIDAREAWATARGEAITEARDELAVHPASGDEGDHPVPPALFGADDAPLIVGEGPPKEKGEAMHKVLELIDLRNPTDVEEVTRSVCELAGLTEHADEVLDLVNACLASPVMDRVRRAERIWREVPYTLRVDDGYVTGRIDLVFEEDGELVVVDWKSDTVAPSSVSVAVEGHREQGEAYVRALDQVPGPPAQQVIFVFPRARAEHSLSALRGSTDD